MAEQDRADAVPAVLNDLVDVDGTPAEGDGLAYSGGAWRPGPGGGVLPQFGPALTLFEGNHSGLLADQTALYAAFEALEMGQVSGYENYPGSHPVMGEWQSTTYRKGWLATEPGVYTVYLWQSMSLSAAPGAGASYAISSPLTRIGAAVWGPDRQTLNPNGRTQVARQDHLTLFVSEEMVDAGVGGFEFSSHEYTPAGAERVNNIYLFAFIERHSPGSTFDYFGGL